MTTRRAGYPTEVISTPDLVPARHERPATARGMVGAPIRPVHRSVDPGEDGADQEDGATPSGGPCFVAGRRVLADRRDHLDRAQRAEGHGADHHRPQRPRRRGRGPRLPHRQLRRTRGPAVRDGRLAPGPGHGGARPRGTRRAREGRAWPEPSQQPCQQLQFSDPRILRAASECPGGASSAATCCWRSIIFSCGSSWGCGIITSHDELTDGPNRPEAPCRVICCATLDRYLKEQGLLELRVAKEIDTGRVEFRIIAYSRWLPIANKLVWAGFDVMGRRIQLTSVPPRDGAARAPAEPTGSDAGHALSSCAPPSGAGPARFEGFS